MPLLTTGAGRGTDFAPLSFGSDLAWWLTFSNPAKRWEDTGATIPALVLDTDTVGLMQDSSATAAHFSTAVEANEPLLTALGAGVGVKFQDATDIWDGNAASLAVSNAAPGFTFAAVIQTPAVLAAARLLFISKGDAAGSTRFSASIEAAGQISLQSRRLFRRPVKNLPP